MHLCASGTSEEIGVILIIINDEIGCQRQGEGPVNDRLRKTGPEFSKNWTRREGEQEREREKECSSLYL